MIWIAFGFLSVVCLSGWKLRNQIPCVVVACFPAGELDEQTVVFGSKTLTNSLYSLCSVQMLSCWLLTQNKRNWIGNFILLPVTQRVLELLWTWLEKGTGVCLAVVRQLRKHLCFIDVRCIDEGFIIFYFLVDRYRYFRVSVWQRIWKSFGTWLRKEACLSCHQTALKNICYFMRFGWKQFYLGDRFLDKWNSGQIVMRASF